MNTKIVVSITVHRQIGGESHAVQNTAEANTEIDENILRLEKTLADVIHNAIPKTVDHYNSMLIDEVILRLASYAESEKLRRLANASHSCNHDIDEAIEVSIHDDVLRCEGHCHLCEPKP